MTPDYAKTPARLGVLRLDAGRLAYAPNKTRDPDVPGSIAGPLVRWSKVELPTTNWTRVEL